MGYYSENLLEADWEAEAARADVTRVARAEDEAGLLFDVSTKDARAEFDAAMASLLGVTGPRWNRARDAAKAKFAADTAPARRLYDRTVEYLIDHSEISEELSDAWDALGAVKTAEAA
ncbi:hypothetical protein [Afipia carboxidovorans]|uniref:hypothetical protein n=1 Tax=Afipia carboxidovorans TaxID=40137 RepID=UPI0030900728|nr:hypothetical protein CRBSH125_01580 [Afipia carboxidovorans]